MALPWNIRGAASQLFFQDRQSSQYEALLSILTLPHTFITDAVDPEEAAQYFLLTISAESGSRTISQFLSDNTQGGGILDWHIPDSQHKELRFNSEADFNKYLTDPFSDEVRERAAKSYGRPHEIFFHPRRFKPKEYSC